MMDSKLPDINVLLSWVLVIWICLEDTFSPLLNLKLVVMRHLLSVG